MMSSNLFQTFNFSLCVINIHLKMHNVKHKMYFYKETMHNMHIMINAVDREAGSRGLTIEI